MSLTYRNPLVIPAAARHTATVIFFHGLGDSGHGWSFAIENFRRREKLSGVKFILPHAPSIPITVNGGYRMPGWYDITDMGRDVDSLRRNEDKEGLLRTTEYVHSLIKQEMDAGIPSNRIVLGGFSQGGAVSLFAGLTAKVKLAGIVALSAYLMLSGQFAELVPKPEFNKDTPVFMGHGDSDMVVPTQLGIRSKDVIKGLGYDVTMKVYPDLEHSADPQEIEDVADFITKVLGEREGEGKSEL
ncbi:Phospholipase/carboxylesterase/thioesterase [Echria macrotheca]|uniref:Acyl-protein thioesterase 1 n=1 Tax=Echria macrotheca TaxID=438768 RepID=A0AAJ0BKE6_9PEZI|nr:Phospholipase/carboxylesterase/thioesterase [Echria macrotheca]